MIGKEICAGALRRLPDGNGHAAVYFVGDEKEGYTIVDPSVYFPEIKVQKLVLTHAHYDHFVGMDRYRESSVPLYMPEPEAWTLESAERNGSILFRRPTVPAPADVLLNENDTVDVNAKLELLVLLTPGHTRGGACYLLREKEGQAPLALLTGDTLITGSMGRTDLPGGDEREMAKSLRKLKDLLKILPSDLPIGCGHASMTTAGRELAYNPFLKSV
jgi:hydroxyacylglutathione hydrolase